jgi:hypothetical protein
MLEELDLGEGVAAAVAAPAEGLRVVVQAFRDRRDR